MMKPKKAAGLVSIVFSPPGIGLIVTLALSIYPPFSGGESRIFSFINGLLFIVVFPVLPVIYASSRGRIEIEVPRREDRGKYLLMSIATYLTGCIFSYIMGLEAMLLTVFSYLIVTSAVLTSNYFTKISIHSTAVAGPATILTFLYGLKGSFLFLALIPVIWARIFLKRHSFNQLILGVFVGVSFTDLSIALLSPFLGRQGT